MTAPRCRSLRRDRPGAALRWTLPAALPAIVALGCGDGGESPTTPLPPAPMVEFEVTDLEEGDGVEAEDGFLVAGAYRGWIYDEALADNRGEEFAMATAEDPLVFRLGAGQVIAGVDRGVAGMRVGGRRRMLIPAADAFGTAGTTSVPANSALVVEFELVFADPVPFSVTELVVGTGAVAEDGKRLTVHYTGWLYDPFADDHRGTQFDSSRDGEAFGFTLGDTGESGVIAGWNEGVVGMRVGGQRRLVIPHDKAYGSAGRRNSIPGFATLLFEIDLLTVE